MYRKGAKENEEEEKKHLKPSAKSTKLMTLGLILNFNKEPKKPKVCLWRWSFFWSKANDGVQSLVRGKKAPGNDGGGRRLWRKMAKQLSRARKSSGGLCCLHAVPRDVRAG